MTGKNENFYKPIKAFHPGITLREKLSEMEMSVKEFALRTSKPEKTINAVLTGASSITPDMSVAFEQVTHITARMWLNLQRNYDEYCARKKREEIYLDETTKKWAQAFPYAKMAALGWVPETRSSTERIKNLFDFFDVTTSKAWEDYYINQELKVAFRISLASTHNPYAVSAWLRQGEVLAGKQSVKNPYSDSALKQVIPEIKQLVEEQPDNFTDRLKELCQRVGIKLVFVHHIQHAPVNGCVRWLGGTPCIQMTDKQKRNDVFWFSFFHEIGHILLHGKKDIFLEDKTMEFDNKRKESEADHFAANILLPYSAELELVSTNDFSKKTIIASAKKYQTHPGIIVGRLQYRGVVPHNSPLNELITHIDLFS